MNWFQLAKNDAWSRKLAKNGGLQFVNKRVSTDVVERVSGFGRHTSFARLLRVAILYGPITGYLSD